MGDLPVIRVERYGDEQRVLVDGKPLAIAVDDGIRIMSAPGYPAGINVTILASTVELTDSNAPRVSDEDKQKVAAYLDSKAPPSSWRPKPRGG
ncbi:hypothetical protein ACOQFV_09060 [Nocardiopsis changdeensis]|uniref:DUF3006 domain-containing protein n=1 Tax=Nocardiopsis changdeensis TaxID=2831969 RepID=A0ABX8BG39_9ACTN|nr:MULTISPECIES: hypothetical protein [Nocardiopsis]QUX20309.1 hypothetical protein KGD84_17420 [Nocardiopsis changdeensis]QYX36239.1 hypothetical protein K1J57_26875 [Nocardiopsis sp. MT53]